MDDIRYIRPRWHKGKGEQHVPLWYAEVDGIVIAEAACTGRPGVDDYPWDVSLRFKHTKHIGAQDTLRSAKDIVAYAWANIEEA
jgi:hypothetical protein